MKRLGELFFGNLQLLLGFLELADVAYGDHQRRCAVEFEGFSRRKPCEHLAVAAPEAHFQVADAAQVQALQQARA